MEVQRNTGLGDVQRNYDPAFIATQFQVLQKPEILYPVVVRLDLVKEFAPPGQTIPLQQVYLRLRRSMQFSEIRNTGLAELGIYDTNPRRAADIANAIAIVYQEKRQLDLSRNIDRGLEPLQKEIEKQRMAVEDAAAKAAVLRLTGGIADPDPDSASSVLQTPPDKELASRYVEAKKRYLQARRILEAIETVLVRERAVRDQQSVKIWERAEAPSHRSSTGLRRLLDTLLP
jgi:uncharacterized protein involved in exopolysaccharide biosynthesis